MELLELSGILEEAGESVIVVEDHGRTIEHYEGESDIAIGVIEYYCAIVKLT